MGWRTTGAFLLGVFLAVLSSGCGRTDFDRGFRENDTLITESWIQIEQQSVDILWVVDTSCSMFDEQEALVEHFPSFIQYFRDLDLPFQMGVTSTNIDEPGSQGLDGHLNGVPLWLTLDTPNLELAFIDRALMGIEEHHKREKGLHASWTAIEELGPTAHAGFVRDEANLLVIVVSDEPDHSQTDASNAEEYISPKEYISWLSGLKETPYQAQLSAIVGISGEGISSSEGCLPENSVDDGNPATLEGALRGSGYIEVAIASGGTLQSICLPDWNETLARLGVTASGLRAYFELREVPALHTLRVSLDSTISSLWAYDADLNAVVFETEEIPNSGVEISVRYEPAEGQD